MLTVGELALFLRTSAARARPELTATTKEYIEGVAKDAEALIGQERGEWAPLAPATVAEKVKLGYYGQVSATDPLLRTGELRGSIKGEAEGTAEGAEGVVGSDSKIAAYQEMGTSRIPARPVMATAMRLSEEKRSEDFGHLAVSLLLPPIR